MPLIKGAELNQELKQQVLRTFVHRWTVENAASTYGGKCPACEQQASCKASLEVNGKPWHEYHNPMTTDEAWLKEHAFYVNKDRSKLLKRPGYCEPAYMADP